MESDTLKYNKKSKVATFLGPTYIRSEENTIYCQYGWYNTEKETSQFSKGAYIEGESNKLTADSMMYHRTSGFGEAFGNITLIDTSEQVSIYGNYGRYQRLEKITLVTGSPRAIKNLDGDSLYFRADTFIDLADTLEGKKRRLMAYRSVKLYKSDMQAISDSMEYNFTDSTIGFYDNPILWAESNQITGDTILVFRNKDGIERLEAYRNGYVIEQDSNRLYNQIKGKHLEAFFINGKIYKVDVDGNGQSVYYVLEDSAKYSGVNDVICGMMTINIDTNTNIHNIVFKNKPKATFYPIEKFPENKSRLQGFNWYSALRPDKILFLN
jgi:lipopolysaccharide export system protein LptA